MCDPITIGLAAGTAGSAAGLSTLGAAALGVGTAGALKMQQDAQSDARDAAQRAADDARNAREAEAARQRQLEEERQARITQGRQAIDTNFAQFNDNFFNSRAQAYEDYALPTLDKQYKDSMRKLVAALSRSGNMQSSTRGELMADLDEDYATQKNNIKSTALDFANKARSSVDNARAELITQNSSLADPNAIQGNALARSQSLAELPTFSPLGNLLADVTRGLATQADLERRQVAAYNTGLFAPRDSGRVVA